MKHPFDKLNSVIKSMSQQYMIYHHVMWTMAIKVKAKKETSNFNIISPYWKYMIITEQSMKIP